MIVKIGQYLNELQDKENQKPYPERRQVPKTIDLVRAIRSRHPQSKLHPVTLYNFVNGNTKNLSLDVAQLVFDELWRMGFKPHVCDLLEYEPPRD